MPAKCVDQIEIGRYFFSIEIAPTSMSCRCGNRIKKGDHRLHVGAYNNINSGNTCMECARKLAVLISKVKETL